MKLLTSICRRLKYKWIIPAVALILIFRPHVLYAHAGKLNSFSRLQNAYYYPSPPDGKPEKHDRTFQNHTGSKYRYSRREQMLVKRTLAGRVIFRMVHPFNRYPHRMV